MGNNKPMYTSNYKEVPIHADLQLAMKPRVAAHTPPRDPVHTDLQLAKKPRGGCPHREAQYIRTNNLQGTLK